MSHGRDGQVFTLDMIASVLVFVLILNLSFMTWNVAERNSVGLNEEKVVRGQVARVADLLVRTPGHPENWTAETVEIVGFTEPDHFIRDGKLDAFGDLSYTEQRDELRATPREFHLRVTRGTGSEGEVIGDQPVAVIVEQSAGPGDQRMHRVMNDSGMVWDLYWPSSSGEDTLSSLTARSVYNYSTDGAAMFDDMLRYATIIGEDTNLDTGDIAEEGLLEGFVENGSAYLHTEEKPELLNETFDVDDVDVGSGNGSIRKVTPLLNGSLRDRKFVQFEDGPGAFKNASTVFVNDTEPPHGCLACGWDIGNGSLYYVADAFAGDGTATTFTRPSDSFGRVLVREFGQAVSPNASVAAVAERQVLVNVSDRRKTGRLKLVFWR